jgi:hypothetical protein
MRTWSCAARLMQKLLAAVEVGDEGVVELVADGHATGGYDAVGREEQVARLLLQRAAAADHVLPPALDPGVVERVREVCGESAGRRCRYYARKMPECDKRRVRAAPVIMVTKGTSLMPAQSRPSDAMRFTCARVMHWQAAAAAAHHGDDADDEVGLRFEPLLLAYLEAVIAPARGEQELGVQVLWWSKR